MPTLATGTVTIQGFRAERLLDEAELAAVAFLARYSGRALDAYRHDLLTLFQWAHDLGLSVLDATRAHIELYRTALEERGLAPSTTDRRLSTVCGYYRVAHIDGTIASNPAQYVRRPKVHPSEGRGMDRGELGAFLFTAERIDAAHAALAVLLGLNGLRGERGVLPPTSRTWDSSVAIASCGSWARATSPPSFPSSLARRGRSTWPSGKARQDRPSGARTVSARTAVPPAARSARSGSGPASARSTRTCSEPPSSWPPSMPVSPCVTSSWRPATQIRGRRPSMTDGAPTSISTPPTSSSRSSRAADACKEPRFAPLRLPTASASRRHFGDAAPIVR